MSKNVKPIPDGYHTVTPYLYIKDAKKALDFYKKAFNAKEILCHEMDGKVCHAEIKIGDSFIMLADEFPEMNVRSPETYGGSPVSLALYVEDVDTIFNQAINAGATVVRPVDDQFYGDRLGCLKDPFGHSWSVATHKEELSKEEIQARIDSMKEKK